MLTAREQPVVMGSSDASPRGRLDRQGAGSRGASASAPRRLLVALALLVGLAPPSARGAAAAATRTSGPHLRGRELPQYRRRGQADAEPELEAATGIIEETNLLEGEIAALERQGGDEAQLEKEVLASVQGELIEVVEAAPDAGAVEEGAIEEIVQVGEEIEELETLDGDGAKLQKEVLASVEADLIHAALPPGCDLGCFFDNHQKLKDTIEHTEEAVVEHFQKLGRKIPKDKWEHACDCRGESAVLEEMVHVEEQIEELENQDGDDAKVEEEVLKSVQEGLTKAVLPPGCNLDCFFNNRPKIADSIERTEEALLDFFQKRNRRVPKNACVCHGEAPVVGEAAPGPDAVEQGAIEEIVHLEGELEKLEDQNGDAATLEEEVLASVADELIEAVLPPGCDLSCFFGNHEKLAGKLEHTEEAVVEHFQKQKRTIGAHACDCPGETAETATMDETGS